MASRFSAPAVSQLSIPCEQAGDILGRLLHDFEVFAVKPYSQAMPYEREWRATTESMVIRAFGQKSNQYANFNRARHEGGSPTMVSDFFPGPSAAEIAAEDQYSFERRVLATRASMKAMVKELQMLMPRNEFVGVYDPSDPFAFYRDLTLLLRAASTNVLVVDAYLGREIFDLYLESIPTTANIQILTAVRPPATVLQSALLAVARVFHSSRPTFEIRVSGLLHDRIVIIDERCWVVGQSLKDAAHKMPTYMVEIEAPEMRTVYEQLWLGSSVVTL